MANPTNRPSPVVQEITPTGGFVDVSASQGSFGYVEGEEVGAAGWQYQRADEGYANTYDVPAGSGRVPLLGDPIRKNQQVGFGTFTLPDGQTVAATPYVKVKSASKILIREYRQQ